MRDRILTLHIFLVFCYALGSIPNTRAEMIVEDSWTTLEPMPTPRHGLGIAAVDGKIYAIGGYAGPSIGTTNINEMYDPTTDTWTTRMPMSAARIYFGIAVVQNKIYIIGGEEDVDEYPANTTSIEVYDPITDTWETKSQRVYDRRHIVANVVNNKIYITGGHVESSYFTYLANRTEVYDPETDTLTTAASIPNFVGFQEALNVASAVIDNLIYVVNYQTLHIYCPANDTWGNGSNLPISTYYGPVAFATSGEFAPKRFHVISGGTHQIYNPDTDVWVNGTEMPTTRRYLGGAVINDRLYAIGGYYPYDDLANNEQYTPIGYVPEFSSWTILLVMIIAVMLIIVKYKLRLSKYN